MLSVKQGDIKYHFLSLWYDSAWDWTPVSRIIGEHSTHSESSHSENVPDFDIVVSEFELRPRYYFYFWTNTLGKSINPFMPSYGLYNTITVSNKDDFGIK